MINSMIEFTHDSTGIDIAFSGLLTTTLKTRTIVALQTRKRVGTEQGWWANSKMGSTLWSIDKHNETTTATTVKSEVTRALKSENLNDVQMHVIANGYLKADVK